MSRSYHVTERDVRIAWNQGDIEPMYLASEKQWVKQKVKEARIAGGIINNRAIVAREKRRTATVPRKER